MLDFPHQPPTKDYTYEFETWNPGTIRIVLRCNRKFDYNLGACTSTVWGFYKSKKRVYYAPINAKSIGKQVNINSTTPYSAMIPNRTPLESAFL
jgi:hypothetical protein